MTPLPSKDQIRQWIADNPGLSSRRDIAKAFGLKGDQRADLRALLRELEAEGTVAKSARRFRPAGALPPVALLRVLRPDAAGDLFAEPMEEGVDKDAGRILVIPGKGDPALAEGDRILARLARVDLDDYVWEARLIRRIGSNPLKVLGVFRRGSEGGRILPIDKGQDKEWRVRAEDDLGARDGELVEGEAVGNRRLGLPQARVTARLGDPGGPRAVSLIAIHQHGIPTVSPTPLWPRPTTPPPYPGRARGSARHPPCHHRPRRCARPRRCRLRRRRYRTGQSGRPCPLGRHRRCRPLRPPRRRP